MHKWWIGLCVAACAWPAAAFEIAGKIDVFSGGQALRESEASEAIVYFRPRVAVPVSAPKEPATMTTRRKDFVPHVLAITAGSSVRFPNADPILHNVFSTSKDNAFDSGLYGQGQGGIYSFNNPGLVRVYCNVHHSMFAYIIVLDTPFFTRPAADGSYLLSGMPAGEGEIVVFHDRGDPWRKKLDLQQDEHLDIHLDLNRRTVPTHMNKFGQPYRPATNANPY